jgi:monoamine oxidase
VQTVLAADPEQLSFLGLLSFLQACGGLAEVADGPSGAQAFRLTGGAQRIADAAATALVRAQGSGVLRLDSPATTVAYSLHGAHVEVRCARETVVCRAAVVAVPPPLWSASLRFEPPLPHAKTAVASALVNGRAAKVVLLYEADFWSGAPASAVPLEQIGPIANLFPSSVGGRPALVGLATGHGAAALGARCPTECLRASLPCRATLHAGHCQSDEHCILLGALTPDAQEAAVTEQLARFFSAAAARRPLAIRVIDWSREPWGAGCFAATWPPGLATSAALGGPSLGTPLCGGEGSGAVFFAASELGQTWPGYFEGALDAGYRAAAEAANFLTAAGSSPNRARL